MIRQRWFEYGGVFGLRYVFDRRGEGLAMHEHQPGHEHNVIVLRGSVLITARDSVLRYPVHAPSIIEELPHWHELTALEDGTELLNLYANGMPAEYRNLAPSERSTTFASRPLENPLTEKDPHVAA